MLYAKLVLMSLFWSGVFPAVNIVLSSMGLFTSVFVRFWFAAVILLVVLRLREHRLPRPSRRFSSRSASAGCAPPASRCACSARCGS
jgi:drug/metabolite transporter (DMT)-like permease